MLQLRETLGQVADMVVIDEYQGAYRRYALLRLRPGDLGAYEIPDDLRPVGASLRGELVELREQRPFHRNPETAELSHRERNRSRLSLRR